MATWKILAEALKSTRPRTYEENQWDSPRVIQWEADVVAVCKSLATPTFNNTAFYIACGVKDFSLTGQDFSTLNVQRAFSKSKKEN